MTKENIKQNLEIDRPISRRDFENYMSKFIVKLVVGILMLGMGLIIAYISFNVQAIVPTEVGLEYPGIAVTSFCSMLFGIVIGVTGVVIIAGGIKPTADKKKNRREDDKKN